MQVTGWQSVALRDKPISLRTPQMSRRSIGGSFALLVAGLVLGGGCGSNDQGTVENKLHDTKSFSAEQLNAPLRPQARARGAQVAPAPTR